MQRKLFILDGQGKMRFEQGKYYEHSSGEKIAIVGCVETTMYGKTLVAEQCNKADLKPIG